MIDKPAGGGQTEILPATWRDLRSLLELERLCFGRDAWPWVDVLASLSFPETVRFKAVREEKAVGFVIGDLRRPENLGWIASIAVHPAHRRQGLARLLLARCEEALGVRYVRLTLRPSNTSAYRLYLTCGYRETDRLERYYRDGEGAIVMEKDREAPAPRPGA
ncbi:MAG TPA: GNAT family N-acetyltransferase [Anaerolineales bacterium]|nr:GNAT family N-acetyltransferase [Anaerolineales bacterium]